MLKIKSTNIGKEDTKVKSLAYEALKEYGIDSLPAYIPSYETSKIHIFSWQQYLRDNPKPLGCDVTKHNGLVMYLGEINKRYAIFYDANLTEDAKHWVIAKLLYYIRSGIVAEDPGTYFPCDFLDEAETFAGHFTCPDTILEARGIVSAEDIMHYCQVPFAVAARKARYLKNKQNKGYLNVRLKQ